MADPRMSTQPFNRALEDLVSGRKITRKAFPKGDYLHIEKNSDTDILEILLHSEGEASEWVPTQEDTLAKDWYELPS